jgi:hypothetical protein
VSVTKSLRPHGAYSRQVRHSRRALTRKKKMKGILKTSVRVLGAAGALAMTGTLASAATVKGPPSLFRTADASLTATHAAEPLGFRGAAQEPGTGIPPEVNPDRRPADGRPPIPVIFTQAHSSPPGFSPLPARPR